VSTVYLYSDGCPGQNKNIDVVRYLFTLVRLGRFEHIQHHFPVRGHSFLPNDRDFGHTETKKKKVERVYVPDQWYDIMKSARKRNPFEVHKVVQEEVKDFGAHLMPYFKKSIRSGKKALRIQNSRVFDYSHSHSSLIWVKYGIEDEDWSKFDILKKNARDLTLPLGRKYTEPLPVKPAKISDVKTLVQKYVPAEFHEFYEILIGNEDVTSETEESESDYIHVHNHSFFYCCNHDGYVLFF
jgi:hypothetical protein